MMEDDKDKEQAESTPETQTRDVMIGVRFYDTRGFYNRTVNDAGDFTIEALVGSPNAIDTGSKMEFARRKRIDPREDKKAGDSARDLRPFTSFYHCQDNMEQRLAELQSRLEEAESEPNGSETVSLKPGKESSEQAVNKRAVKELQLYIDFTPRSISYGDIPLLFRAGDLACVPPEADIRSIPNSDIQTVFKMVHSLRHNCWLKGNIVWSIYCLDYREGKYTPVWRKIQFPHFDGLANINEMPCYPLKFHPDCKGLLAQQIKGGENFRKCVEAGNRDIYYSGWTLVTGKTLTAEAVAAENNKPLFPIASGDLGFTPDKVEQSLKEIFRYAHLWGCILLLDEADVFFDKEECYGHPEERARCGDVYVQAVFLRVVEYYNGILFLTTNRVGAIDEAFRSRIHISLNYKHLDCADTMAILDTHLKRLPRRNPKSAPHGNGGDGSGGTVLSGGADERGMLVMDREIREYIRQEWQSYAKKHKRERGPWNGRQIRNAVYVATSLAIYENQLDNSRGAGDGDGDGEGGRGSSTDPVVLTTAHFQTVGDSTREFDEYMKRVRRADADTMARMAGERDDFYDDETYEMARFEGFSGPAHHDEDEGEAIPEPEFGDGDEGDNEQWEEDSFAYREKSLHHKATNQNRGYAWGRGEGSG
ncbi:hypothetical protein MKX07_003899 [Trichoderma sp. CBMAI-0711]|nr:hypothetical protein MKX07_003899 [Trichoderma sp. CBMAI-0711]